MTLIVHAPLSAGTQRALRLAGTRYGVSGRALARGLARVLRVREQGQELLLGNALLKLKLIDLQTAFDLVQAESLTELPLAL